MILAINANNVVLSEAIVGTGVNGQVFKEFLINLINILGTDEEYTLLMDNVRFHHVNKEFAEAYPYNLVYLPPYSPFLNPCEETFSKIKNRIRRDGRINGTNDLISRMETAVNSITADDLNGFISHSESFFNSCLERRDIGRD